MFYHELHSAPRFLLFKKCMCLYASVCVCCWWIIEPRRGFGFPGVGGKAVWVWEGNMGPQQEQQEQLSSLKHLLRFLFNPRSCYVFFPFFPRDVLLIIYYLLVIEQFSGIHLLSCSSQYQNEKAFCLLLCLQPALLCQTTHAEGSPAWFFPLWMEKKNYEYDRTIKGAGSQVSWQDCQRGKGAGSQVSPLEMNYYADIVFILCILQRFLRLLSRGSPGGGSWLFHLAALWTIRPCTQHISKYIQCIID